MFTNYEELRLKKQVLLLQLLLDASNDEEKELYKRMLRQSNSKNHILESHCWVYKYDPTNLTDYTEVFPNLLEAALSLNNANYTGYQIKEAAESNTLFAGFRWYYMNNDADPPSSIPESVTLPIEAKA